MERAVRPGLRTWTGSDGTHSDGTRMLGEFDRLSRPYEERHAREAIHGSTSWRVTAPLRFVRARAAGRAHAG